MKSLLECFKKKIKNNEYVYGSFIKSSDPMISEIAGISGFDFLILDTEHGPTDIENQQNNIRACEARGILPIVRVPYIDDNTIGKAMDIGAYGIQVSQIRNAEDAKKVVEYTKFFPNGKRGVCRFVRAADYSAMPKNDYFISSNDNLIILQLEGIDAIRNLDEILEVEGYDIIFIGPYDLSQSLGVPGDVKNSKVLSAMINIIQKAKSRGKLIGTFTDDYEMVEKWKSLGVVYIAHSTDSGLFYEKMRDTYNKLKTIGTKHSIAKVLDCTLRDGGYVNSWKFGFSNIKRVINSLVKSRINYIECGFLTQKTNYSIGVTKFNNLSEVNKLIPKKSSNYFAVMINYGEFNIKDLPEYPGYGVNCIRVAFHKKNLIDALEYCKSIKEKGYNVFVQAMVSLNYTDSEYLYLIRKCNEFKPYALYVVDSFGVMKSKEVLHYFKMLERELDNDIYPGFHAHNNMQLAFSNAICLLNDSNREFIIDSSIHGMGRGAGNLNTEILIEYLNDNYLGDYSLSPILEANDLVIERIYSKLPWGYSLPNYLSAKHNCHPNYANYLKEKNNLTVEDINFIFDMLDENKKVEYDKIYIEQLYNSYLESRDKPHDDFEKLKNILYNKKVIMVCPGKTSITKYSELLKIYNDDFVVISVNFYYDKIEPNYIFVGNNKRMSELDNKFNSKIIATTNIPNNDVFAKINYSSLLNDDENVKDNTGLMLLQLLKLCNIDSVYIIGMDGYRYNNDDNYLNDDLILTSKNETIDNLNFGIKKQMDIFEKNMKIIMIK